MFFDAEQTLIAVQQVERPRPFPVQRGSGKSNAIVPLIVGILIGRKLPR